MKTFRLLLVFAFISGLKLCSFGDIEETQEPLFYLNLPDNFLDLLKTKFAILNEEGNIRNKFLNREFSLPYKYFKTFFDKKYPFIQTGKQENVGMSLCFITEEEKANKSFIVSCLGYPYFHIENDSDCFMSKVSQLMDSYVEQKYFRDSEEVVAENAAIAYYLFVLCNERIPFNILSTGGIHGSLMILMKTLKDGKGQLPAAATELKGALDEDANKNIADGTGCVFKVYGEPPGNCAIVQWVRSYFSSWFN